MKNNSISIYNLRGHVYLLLNGYGPFKKRRFVLEVVKYYLKEKPDATISEIKEVFSDDLLGQHYLGHLIEEDILSARKMKDKNGSTRHMLEKDAILTSGDNVRFVVSSQWDYRNTIRIVKLAQDLGWKVELLGRRLDDKSHRVFENGKV